MAGRKVNCNLKRGLAAWPRSIRHSKWSDFKTFKKCKTADMLRGAVSEEEEARVGDDGRDCK